MKKSFSDTCNFAPLTGNFLYSKKSLKISLEKLTKDFISFFVSKAIFCSLTAHLARLPIQLKARQKLKKYHLNDNVDGEIIYDF